MTKNQGRPAVTDQQKIIASRLLAEQIDQRERKNALYEKNFGARMTLAFQAECEQRAREIDALKAVLATLV